MLRILVVLGLLLLMFSTAFSQGKNRSWLRGTWEGTGYQTDDQSTWSMRLVIVKLKNGRRAFSIEYPSLNCGGRWKLLGSDQKQASFREVLNHGMEKCANNGRVEVERKGRQLVFLYSNQGSRELTASAILNRKRPAARQ